MKKMKWNFYKSLSNCSDQVVGVEHTDASSDDEETLTIFVVKRLCLSGLFYTAEFLQ